MTPLNFTSPDDIRAAFSSALSAMYRQEVPLYGELIDIVEAVNGEILRDRPDFKAALDQSGDLDRLSAERHGAIRIGTGEELSLLRRAFALMGLYPVGYYDLAVAGVPVHSTAFRPITAEGLRRSPFRVFTSLLRPELIADAGLRATAQTILARRSILTAAAYNLIEKAETEGGLDADEADRFVAELLETFRWRGDALVDAPTYQRLNQAHRLVADIVSFRGPHINHLTPRTLDIDRAQAEMLRRGIDAKAVIEGPPRRHVPILLRQTSFKALDEKIGFIGERGRELGTHTARFGEIEQRGVALTPRGRALYDSLLDTARGDGGSQGEDYGRRLEQAFAAFPDSEQELREQSLAYFRYAPATGCGEVNAGTGLPELIASGHLKAEPITYEDFLPVSAAGIFQSNLGGEEQGSYTAQAAQQAFEEALGCPVLDPFQLYAQIEQDSLARSLDQLRAKYSSLIT